MKVSESTANALRKAEGSAFSEAFNRTASTQEGLSWASSIAQKSGNTEAYSLLNEARNMSRAQESTGENLTVEFVTDYARHHFDGSTTPEALQRAADFLNNRVTEGGLKGQQYVHKAYADFYARRGGYGNGTPATVEQGIKDWGGQATGGLPAGVPACNVQSEGLKPAPSTPKNFREDRMLVHYRTEQKEFRATWTGSLWRYTPKRTKEKPQTTSTWSKGAVCWELSRRDRKPSRNRYICHRNSRTK